MTTQSIPTSLRRTFLGALAVVVAASFVAPGGAAQTQSDFWQSSSRTFYLHLAQYCERDVSLIRWIDEFDWPNDLDGCGGLVHETQNSWTDTFPSFVPLHANVTPSTTASMHIFILSRAVDQTTVSAELDVGYATCGGTSAPALILQEKIGGYHEFVIECTFQLKGPANSTVRPLLTVTVSATHTYGYGSEGDHASYFDLNGLEPAPPKEVSQFFSDKERPKLQFEQGENVQLAELPGAPAAAAKSPTVGPALTVAIASVAMLALRRLQASR